jgi:hypothetical protein
MRNPEATPLSNEDQDQKKEENRIENPEKAEVMAEEENKGRYWVGEYRKYLDDPESYKNSMNPDLLDNITPCFRNLNETGITPEMIEESINGASKYAGDVYDFEQAVKDMTSPELRVEWLKQWVGEKIAEQKRQWTWSGKREATFQPISPIIKESDSFRKASNDALLAHRKKCEITRELERRNKEGRQEEK